MIVKKEWVKRAARTFVQTAVGTFSTGIAAGFELSNWKTYVITLAASAISAGIAAIMNMKGDNINGNI